MWRLCRSWSRTRSLPLPAGDWRREAGMAERRVLMVGLLGASSEFLGFRSEGLLQTFFRRVMSCKDASGFPRADWNAGDART